MTDLRTDPAGAAQAAAAVLAERTGVARHDLAIVLGSGWVPAVDVLGETIADFPVTDLPGFLPPAVEGHAGRIRSLDVGGKRVLAFLGRTHLYEGRGVEPVVHGVRVAAAVGCSTIVLTNACGCLKQGIAVGDPVLISDHLNFTGRTGLVGPRFVDLTDVYARRLRDLVHEIDPSIVEGVYAQFPGPQYETPAEVRMAGILGADLVGMSTVLEAVAAHAEGCEVLGISLVTNLAAGLGDPLDHEEVLAVGTASATRMGELLGQVIPRI
ncbi:purine-nucleoside phosphorylase [uncultured Jatrophihabitans sp.]|uniref:purine-nucleoside phosphorylase n=1 Tax=uncultured Jatrophihabitans sp. TaxID=1610747 RepID=UPI0035CA6CEF